MQMQGKRDCKCGGTQPVYGNSHCSIISLSFAAVYIPQNIAPLGPKSFGSRGAITLALQMRECLF
jgi:hypothetical protein